VAEVRELVVQIVTEVCRPDPVDLSDHARSLFECGLDSVDFASVMIAVEDRFKVALADDDLVRLGSIDGMTAYIEERQSDRG
jgi:acyl carrier protein